MDAFIHTVSELAAVAAGSLVAAVWEGLVLAAVVAVCLGMLPGITAAARSVVWSAAMVVVVLLPFLRFGGGVGVGSARWHVDERVSLALACVWAALSLFRAGQLVRSAVWLRGIAQRAVPVADADARSGAKAPLIPSALLVGLKPHPPTGMAGHGDGRRAVLCVSEEVDRPSVVGFFAPRILIPSSLLERLSGGELEQIVLHEMEHLRRGDDWTNLLQKLSLVVFPLNPVLVWIERRLCLERELACDDQVLRATNARKAYAACLANLAEHSLVRRGVSLALGAWERQSELVRRVHRILFRPEREMGRRQVGMAVGVMLAGLLGGADVLAHAPRMVSFGPAAPMVVAENGVRTVVGSGAGRVPGVAAENVMFHAAAKSRPRAKARSIWTGDIRGVETPRSHQRTNTLPPTVVMTAMAEQREMEQPEVAPSPVQGERMVVMVTWRAVRMLDADGNPVTVAVQSSQFSYAAVPTRNGWLFVQL